MSDWSNSHQWRGRQDPEDGERGLRWHNKVVQVSSTELAGSKQSTSLSLVGLACDLGVSNNQGRVGARQGPSAIRDALANFAWHHGDNFVDLGTVSCPPLAAMATLTVEQKQSQLDTAQQHYAELIQHAVENSAFTVGLGGGHEIAWGSYCGLFNSALNRVATRVATRKTDNEYSKGQQQPLKKRIGIVNLDAHFDLRRPAPLTSSGTPFWQIHQACQQQGQSFNYCCFGIAETANTPALFDFAKDTNSTFLLDRDCHFDTATKRLTEFLADIDLVYLTVCLDAFPAADAPGVSAPSALGIGVEFAIQLIHWLAEHQTKLNYHWPLADIAELNPSLDIDQRTAKLAARLLFEMHKAKQRQV